MNMLLIGGTGLISTAITRALLDRGDAVTIYNRGQTDLSFGDRVNNIIGDRQDFNVFERQMAAAGTFDCVIDMICFRPAEAESVVRAFQGRIGQLILCSTVDVYAKPARTYPITEHEERRASQAFPYAFNKVFCETTLQQASQQGAFPLTIIRPAMTYGEGRGLVHTFRGGMYYLDRIRQGKPMIVHGDGTSLWVACHRDDVARAFVEAVGNPKTIGNAYHVTGAEWMTWDSYHQKVAEAMHAPAPTLIHIPTDLLGKVVPHAAEWCVVNFQFNNIFDNTAAQTDLKFRYTIPWVEGVRRVVAWLDERGQIDSRDEPPWYDRLITTWEHLGGNLAQELQTVDT